METNEVQIIDASRMTPLTEFPASGVLDNIVAFRIGIVGDDVVIAARGSAGDWGGALMFERNNAKAATDLLKDLLHGRMSEEGREFSGYNAGKDRLGVSAQMPRDQFSYSFYNNRLVKMNGFQTRSWNINMTPDTALGIYVELDELLKKGLL